MIYVFYSNDPLAQDIGGGAEHFRGLYRALRVSGLHFQLVGARLQSERSDPRITYISKSSHFLKFYLALWLWFWRHRKQFRHGDVFHFHRNYAAWPKLVFAPKRGRVIISYHNVTGRVLEGLLGSFGRPIRRLMLAFERRVAALADAIICVSSRDRLTLQKEVAEQPFEKANVIPAAFDQRLFKDTAIQPPQSSQSTKLLALGRISHQKNMPLAVAVLEWLHERGFDYSLTIAGHGEDAKQLIRRIAESPVSGKINWIGGVDHDQVPGLMAEHGILLLTSRYEASPTVVKEALRCKRPVVSTDVGDVADWIDQERSGMICEHSADALGQGVLATTRIIREGRYAQGTQIEAMDEQAIMAQVLRLYRRLAAV